MAIEFCGKWPSVIASNLRKNGFGLGKAVTPKNHRSEELRQLTSDEFERCERCWDVARCSLNLGIPGLNFEIGH